MPCPVLRKKMFCLKNATTDKSDGFYCCFCCCCCFFGVDDAVVHDIVSVVAVLVDFATVAFFC